jgi:Fe-S-cluster containining protein
LEKEFKAYIELRNDIDKMCGKLWNELDNHMQCKAGCSSCCQAFKILPVEFEYIKRNISVSELETNQSTDTKSCKFLVNKRCSIYENRPIICRTHGFPLVRLNEEVEEYEVSFCELNFKKFPLENFTSENVLLEDQYNSNLYQLNKKYLKAVNDTSYDVAELIEVNALI